MSLGPLSQAPFLDNFCWFDQLHEFAGNVATEELELATRMGTSEGSGWAASEGCQAGGVGESGVEFGGRGAELLGRIERGDIYQWAFATGLCLSA